LRNGPGEIIAGNVVTGAAVTTNNWIKSALNPAWRKAILHVIFGRGRPEGATLSDQQAVRKNLTNVEVPLLKSVEGPDKMGAYLNEADAYEPDFQFSFWGANYARLDRIKQRWDPKGLFISRKGVGSEDWDDAGLCRLV